MYSLVKATEYAFQQAGLWLDKPIDSPSYARMVHTTTFTRSYMIDVYDGMLVFAGITRSAVEWLVEVALKIERQNPLPLELPLAFQVVYDIVELTATQTRWLGDQLHQLDPFAFVTCDEENSRDGSEALGEVKRVSSPPHRFYMSISSEVCPSQVSYFKTLLMLAASVVGDEACRAILLENQRWFFSLKKYDEFVFPLIE